MVVAPARAVPPGVADRVTDLASHHVPELELQFHPQCFAAHGHFAGDDTTRKDTLIEAANDPDLDAIWFGRGGYGSARLLSDLVANLGPAARQKTYLGYSDTGALLATLYGAGIGNCIHGPMPSDVQRIGGEAAVLRALQALKVPVLQKADARPQIALNLTVLASLNGTPFLPDLTGHILHLEDIGEYHYRLDRAFAQLASSAWFSRLAGVRLGRFSDVPENDIDFAMTADEIARHWCAAASVPVIGTSPIGHDADNGVVVFG